MNRPALLAAVLAAALLAGCELPGLDGGERLAASREAEGKAVGAGCRQAGRAIEDCYALNRRTDKAAIVAGWRDMNDYMRENKIEPMTPVLVAQGARATADARGETKDAREGKPPARDAEKDAGRSGH